MSVGRAGVCLVSLVVFSAFESRIEAATFRERVDQQLAAQPDLIGNLLSNLSPAGQEAFEELCDASDTKGRMLSLTEFFDFLCNPPSPFPRVNEFSSDITILSALFRHVQKPIIDKGELISLREAIANSLQTIEIHYKTTHVQGPEKGLVVERRFVMDGRRLFFESEYSGGPETVATGRLYREAYDLKVFRAYGVPYAGGIGTGSIGPLENLGRFFSDDNPLRGL